VGLAQRPMQHLEEVPEPKQHIVQLASRMRTAIASLSESPYQFDQRQKVKALSAGAECLEALIAKLGTPTVPPRFADAESKETSLAWQQFSSLYAQCIHAAKPFGGNDGLQIIDYRVSNQYPQVFSPPNWDYYMNTVTKMRGGEERNFSSKTFLGASCRPYIGRYPQVYGPTVLKAGDWPWKPQNALRHVTYLSDGLCGSTCSVASTSPYLAGLTTFVTFGGIKGDTLDITSFNGGNVGTYQGGRSALWKHALSPAVDAGIYFPEEESPTWPFAPIPMNLLAVRFAQRAEYPRALGPNALPREWYTIPASYHLDVWSSLPLDNYNHLSVEAEWKLYDLYRTTSALDPKPLKKEQ